MLRNEILYFCYLGTFIERFDNTARILDVRHFLFMPNTMVKNDVINETQWEAILRSLSAYRAYMWQNQNELNAINISNFLILDDKMPRSLKFSLDQILKNIKLIKNNKVKNSDSFNLGLSIQSKLLSRKRNYSYDFGLHNYLDKLISSNIKLGNIYHDYFFKSTGKKYHIDNNWKVQALRDVIRILFSGDIFKLQYPLSYLKYCFFYFIK